MREPGGPRRRPRSPGSRHWLSYLYVGIGALLLLAAFLLLYPLRHVSGFTRDLRINVGSNLLDLVLAVLVLQPLIVSLSRNAVRWRNRLDYWRSSGASSRRSTTGGTAPACSRSATTTG